MGCCLFPTADITDNIPLEARWLFNDMTKTTGDDQIKCTFVSPFSDKVSVYFPFLTALSCFSCLLIIVIIASNKVYFEAVLPVEQR